MRYVLLLLFSLSLFAEDPEIPLSSPEQIVDFSTDSLIGGVISPLSGQVCLRATDLVARGAQNVYLSRTYVSPLIPKLHPHPDFDRYHLSEYLKRRYKGWLTFPQDRLEFFQKKHFHYFRVSDPNAITIDFVLRGNEIHFASPPLGFSNASGDKVGGRYDLRNCRASRDQRTGAITVLFPDGTQRVYNKNFKKFILLHKEILPNGKIIKFTHNDNGVLTKVESFDPRENYAYASINLLEPSTSTDIKAQYQYEQNLTFIDAKDKKYGSIQGSFWAPPLLTLVSSPFFRNEKIEYNSCFLIEACDNQQKLFSCTYDLFGDENEKHYRVRELLIGKDPTFKFEYIPTIFNFFKKVEGRTKVTHWNGSYTIYSTYINFLPKSVEDYDENGVLKKRKCYIWNKKQYLESLTWYDSDKELLRKAYEYDEFGNPKLECIHADGMTYSIYRRFSQDGRHLLLSEKKDFGPLVTNEYLPGTNLITKKTSEASCQTFSYDVFNNLIEETISDGYKTTQTRYILRQSQPFLHMPEWTETYGGDGSFQKRVHLTYDQFGNVCQEDIDADDISYSILNTYNERGDLLSEKNALGQTAFYTYDKKGRLETSTNFSGKLKKSYLYNAKGELQQEEHNDRLYRYTYDLSGNLKTKTDYLNRTTTFDYDLLVNKPTGIHFGDRFTSIRYDILGNDIETIDPNGNKTCTTYNAFGFPKEITYPDGSKETFTYRSDNLLDHHTDLNGLKTSYRYDLQSRVVEKDYQGLAKETFTFEGLRLVSKKDKGGNETSYHYDRAGRLIAEKSHDRPTEYEYDSLGRTTQEKKGHLCTSYKYDLLNQLLEVLKKDDQGNLLQRTAYTYDADQNLQSITEGSTLKKTLNYDPFGRLASSTDALGHTTQLTYDDIHRQKTTVFPHGLILTESFDDYDQLARKVTSQNSVDLASSGFIYDLCGNLLKQTETDNRLSSSQEIEYSYNQRNQLSQTLRSHKRTTSYTYTPSGLLATKTLPDGTVLSYQYDLFGQLRSLGSSDYSINQAFDYDLNGKIIVAKDQQIVVLRAYDVFGNVAVETFPDYQVIKAYDAFNRPLTLDVKDKHIQYDYDPLFLKSIQKENLIHQYTYGVDGLLKQEILPFGLGEISYFYDAKGRRSKITAPYFEETYTYDLADNLISQNSHKFTYDSLSQQTSENGHTYSYDFLYNRLSKNDQTIHTNDLNEILSDQVTYDFNGNLKKKGQTTFIYDALSRLTKALSPDFEITYAYDAFGRTIKRIMNGKEEIYLYDGETDIGTLDQDFRIPGVSVELHTRLYITLSDLQGSLTHLIDSETQSLIHSYHFSAFGEHLDSCLLPFNPWGFASKRLDPHLHLINFGKRFYDPELARWLTVDPLGPIDSINLYLYTFNNPYKFYDPDGRFVLALPLFSFCLGAGALIPPAFTVLAAAVAVGVASHYVYKGVKALDKWYDTYYNSSIEAGTGQVAEEQPQEDDNDVIHVTPQGVALPGEPKYKIPEQYVENKFRPGSYGEIIEGKFNEKLRIDPATPPGKKGPNYSHYHLNNNGTHYSPNSKDPGFN